jgi:transposase-like protein
VNEKLVITRYSEEVKRAAVHAVEELGINVGEVCRDYHIKAKRTVYRWIQRYGSSSRPTKVVRVIMKSEQEKIRELENLVADLSVRSRLLKAQVEIYEEVCVDDIKKKLSTKQLQGLEEKKQRLARLGS